jgi:hypothetical protein
VRQLCLRTPVTMPNCPKCQKPVYFGKCLHLYFCKQLVLVMFHFCSCMLDTWLEFSIYQRLLVRQKLLDCTTCCMGTWRCVTLSCIVDCFEWGWFIL